MNTNLQSVTFYMTERGSLKIINTILQVEIYCNNKPLSSRKEEKAKHDMRLGIGFGRVWLNESLSNHYGSMLWRCRMLHKQSIIDSFWFFNGRLYVKVIENGRKIEVVDDDDLAEATGVNMIEFVKQFTKRDA